MHKTWINYFPCTNTCLFLFFNKWNASVLYLYITSLNPKQTEKDLVTMSSWHSFVCGHVPLVLFKMELTKKIIKNRCILKWGHVALFICSELFPPAVSVNQSELRLDPACRPEEIKFRFCRWLKRSSQSGHWVRICFCFLVKWICWEAPPAGRASGCVAIRWFENVNWRLLC